MKIGFDIDDTLINLREHAFHFYNKKLNQNVPIQSFHSLKTVEIHKPFGLSDQEGREMWKNSMEDIYFSDCPPFPHAVAMVNELKNTGHEIYYITSRPSEHCNRTQSWLIKKGFPVQPGSFFCGMKDSEKINIIKNLGIDYYFDDKPAVLETLRELGLNVYVKNTSYNQHLDLPRIECWSKWKEIFNENEPRQ